jgi:hypothetical protein
LKFSFVHPPQPRLAGAATTELPALPRTPEIPPPRLG